MFENFLINLNRISKTIYEYGCRLWNAIKYCKTYKRITICKFLDLQYVNVARMLLFMSMFTRHKSTAESQSLMLNIFSKTFVVTHTEIR